ncbi:DUF2441 domain-containing protein [Salmonella enterica]|nr:hypothetical protein [Salmonella enterica subsp. enterica serovar Muenchen]EJO3924543.1 DUF2441 domain-containing protein [Salmonella enterica]
MRPETEKAAKRQPVNMCQMTSGGAYPAFDIVKSPKVTLQTQGFKMTKRKFRFYHADRGNLLSPDMTIIPVNGLSVFGEHYLSRINSGNVSDVLDENVQREMLYENVRMGNFPSRPSRFSCLFGANSIPDAESFARKIIPQPTIPINIYEVFAENFVVLDMNWMDYITTDMSRQIEYARQYWYSSITQHAPLTGDRMIPTLEVLLPLPVEVGKQVSTVAFD